MNMRLISTLAVLLSVSSLLNCAGEEALEPELAKPVKEETPAPPKKKDVLAMRVTGTFGSDSTVEGTLSYVIAQGPSGTDVRNLTPNVVYLLDGYELTVVSASLESLLPSTTYRHGDQGTTVEFCAGVCVLGSPTVVTLTFKNNSDMILTLAFVPTDPTPLINPPGTVAEWGTLATNIARYETGCHVCGGIAMVHTGGVTELPKGHG